MNESLPLLAPHLRVGITENEADGSEEIAFSRAIATDNDIELWRERINYSLVLVAAGKVRRDGKGKRVASCLLKPWMVICLMCIFSQSPQRPDESMQNSAYVDRLYKLNSGLGKDAERDDPNNASPT